eukprot:scaffold2036_cov115-Isochrysis_galbana.AAC.5
MRAIQDDKHCAASTPLPQLLRSELAGCNNFQARRPRLQLIKAVACRAGRRSSQHVRLTKELLWPGGPTARPINLGKIRLLERMAGGGCTCVVQWNVELQMRFCAPRRLR